MPAQPSEKDAFALAKEALSFVGEFRTPPTPEVYEVWYRYVENLNDELRKQMDHAVNEAKVVSAELLASMFAQFCSQARSAESNVGQSMASELNKIQSLVTAQRKAGSDMQESIKVASGFLTKGGAAEIDIAACIAELTDGTSSMKRQLAVMARKLEESQQQVEQLQNDLAYSQRGMMTDHLTGIGNRRFFDTLLKKMISGFDESESQTYLALLDMDHFKQINDSVGHDAGDQLLQFIVTQITTLRPDVSIARLGGDEFAVFLRVKSREDAVEFTDVLREHFVRQRLHLRHSREQLGTITFSIGVARLRSADDEVSLYGRADKLLYRAKELGRNRAVIEN